MRLSEIIPNLDPTAIYSFEVRIEGSSGRAITASMDTASSVIADQNGNQTPATVKAAAVKIITFNMTGAALQAMAVNGKATLSIAVGNAVGFASNSIRIENIKINQYVANSSQQLAIRIGAGYKYGFNGQERDDEVAGSGNSYTATFWQYDSRLGRRWNIDPVVKHWESSYASFNNNPIAKTDPNGDNADWVKGKDGDIKWDDNANDQSTTKAGETYLGKDLTFTFNSNIDAGLWDGPLGSIPAGDKLTSTITLSATENSKGQLTGLSASTFVKIGETPMGTARDFYPGLGSDQNKFSFNQSKNADGTLGSFSLNFEQHSSVSPIEQFGMDIMGYDIVNVAQGFSLNYSSSKLSISAATDVFPSASLTVNGFQLFQYNQPSFTETHGRNKSFYDNGVGGVGIKTTPKRPAPSLINRYSK